MGLLSQLVQCEKHIASVVVTHNIPCDEYPHPEDYSFNVINIHNESPQGFGANHNQAFKHCLTNYFCVMNPDIYLEIDPFGPLLLCDTKHDVTIIAPVVVNLDGIVEDNARYFPSLWGLARKVFCHYDGVYPVQEEKVIEYPDWLAGMFLLAKSERYAELSGFDESFFLYYEDVDLCLRAWKKEYTVALCTNSVVIHDARRSSHRNFRFFLWHAMSAFRFFWKHWGRFPTKRI